MISTLGRCPITRVTIGDPISPPETDTTPKTKLDENKESQKCNRRRADMDSQLRPSSKEGKDEIPKSTLDSSTKKDDPLAKQPTKDELNEPRVNEGCAAPNTNTENETPEALKIIFFLFLKFIINMHVHLRNTITLKT